MPPGFKPYGTCCWCAGEIVYPPGHKKAGERHARKNWHDDCVGWFFVAGRSVNQRELLERRTPQRCGLCGVGVGQPFISGWRVLGESTAQYSLGLKNYWAGRFTRIEPRWGNAWDADHIVPLWSLPDPVGIDQRGCFFGLANLWRLCQRCHQAKTAREAKARALRNKELKAA